MIGEQPHIYSCWVGCSFTFTFIQKGTLRARVVQRICGIADADLYSGDVETDVRFVLCTFDEVRGFSHRSVQDCVCVC